MYKLRFPLKSLGDYWTNWFSVARKILRSPIGSTVELDKLHEGWCLYASGAEKLIGKILEKRQDLVGKICIINDRNCAPGPRFLCSDGPGKISHFFPMSRQYDVPRIIKSTSQHRFGYFVGRSTLPRMKLFHDIHTKGWQQYFLMSKMSSCFPEHALWEEPNFYLDRPGAWFDSEPEFLDFKNWVYNYFNVGSIDHSTIQDQFVPGAQTNRNLVKLSHGWSMEIIFETCTNGASFFPTEKTIRPMLVNKPFLIYGAPNFLENLRALGFQTFGQFWDESYDYFGQKHRYCRILDLINMLVDLRETEFVELMEHCKKICDHNQSRARQLGLTQLTKIGINNVNL